MKSISRTLALVLALALSLFADDKKIAPDAGKSGTVIVQFKNDPDSALQARLSLSGARLKQYLGNLKAGLYEVPTGRPVLNAISNEAQVHYITSDRPVAASLDHAVSSIYADFKSSGYATGKGITVAVIDSGVNATADLTTGVSRVIYREDFTGGNNPNDQFGHGTHVASMLGGDGSLSEGNKFFRTFRGVAPEVRIVSLKVLDAKGMGTESAVVRAIDRAISLSRILNIRVINLSLGRPVLESYKTDPLCQAVERAWKAGIVVVVAAGNEGRNNLAKTKGYGMIMSPGNDPYVITVGAMKDMANNGSRTDDQIASYSSKGPSAADHVIKPDLVAPGNMIIADAVPGSLLWNTAPASAKVKRNVYEYTTSTAFTSDYIRLSGTSMSAALVSGAAALMLDRDDDLSPNTIKARLMKTAYKTFPRRSKTVVNGKTYWSYYDIFTVGAGFLDVQAALRNRDVVRRTQSAQSPVAAWNKKTKKAVMLVMSQNIIWGGDEEAWGTNIIWGGDEVSGENIIWGGDEVTAFNIIWGGDEEAVWGESGVAGNNIIWGSNIIWGGDDNSWGGESVRTTNIIWGGLVDEDVTTVGDPQ